MNKIFTVIIEFVSDICNEICLISLVKSLSSDINLKNREFPYHFEVNMETVRAYSQTQVSNSDV